MKLILFLFLCKCALSDGKLEGGKNDNQVEQELLSSIPKATDVIGFDCSGDKTGVAVVDLDKVGRCVPPQEFGTPKQKNVQVIQRRKYEKIHVRTCYIKVERHIKYCGSASHSAEVANGMTQYIKFLGPDGCNRVHETGGLQFERHYVSDVKPNSTKFTTLQLRGSLDISANCRGTDYTDDNNISYSNVQVRLLMEIRLADYTATAMTQDGDLTLRNGIVCELSRGYCVDYEVGEVTWHPIPKGDCREEAYDVLFQGPANFTTVPGNITYVMVADGTHVFAMQVRKSYSVCSQAALLTEHERIFIVEESQFGFHFKKEEAIPANTDMMTYYNTKASAQELTNIKRINDLQLEAIYDRCKLKREIMLTKLANVRNDMDSVIQMVKQDVGYAGVLKGRVLEIYKCAPVPVSVRNTTECYQQLPVTYMGKPYFLSEISKILVPHGEQVSCAGLVPPMHKLGGKWMAFGPEMKPSSWQPQVLSPDADEPLNFKMLTELGDGGLYSAELMQQVQESLQFPNQRAAVMNVITKSVVGQDVDVEGYSPENFFSTRGLERIRDSLFNNIKNKLLDFGNWVSIVIGFVTIGIILKTLIDVSFYSKLMYQAFGCGWAMLGGLCTGMASAMLHTSHRTRWMDVGERWAAERVGTEKEHARAEPEGTPFLQPAITHQAASLALQVEHPNAHLYQQPSELTVEDEIPLKKYRTRK